MGVGWIMGGGVSLTILNLCNAKVNRHSKELILAPYNLPYKRYVLGKRISLTDTGKLNWL